MLLADGGRKGRDSLTDEARTIVKLAPPIFTISSSPTFTDLRSDRWAVPWPSGHCASRLYLATQFRLSTLGYREVSGSSQFWGA
jgi:hypothetical protein